MLEKNKQFSRFAAVGAVSTAIDFTVLLTLKYIGLPVITSNIISTSCAFVFSFSANKKYTFKTKNSNIAREMILFILFTLIGLWLIQGFIIHFTFEPLTSILGNNKTLGLLGSKLIATVASLTWNYITYSRYVFNDGSQ